MRYIILSVCSAFATSTKWRISAPIVNKINFFRQSPKSPNHTGLQSVKKTHPRLGHAWTPLITNDGVTWFDGFQLLIWLSSRVGSRSGFELASKYKVLFDRYPDRPSHNISIECTVTLYDGCVLWCAERWRRRWGGTWARVSGWPVSLRFPPPCRMQTSSPLQVREERKF